MKVAFNSITPKLIAHRRSVHEVCRQFNRSPSKGNLKRVKALFQKCGEDVIIESGIHMDYGQSIVIGDRVYININCTMLDGATKVSECSLQEAPSLNPSAPLSLLNPSDTSSLPRDFASIIIGDDCLIGPNVQLLSISHDVDPTLRKTNKHNYVETITLGNNVWIGGGVIVLAGVKVGDNSVIGAGSIVTKNIEENSFYAGNPAVKVRNLSTDC